MSYDNSIRTSKKTYSKWVSNNPLIEEGLAKFRLNLLFSGVNIGRDRELWLRKHGYINADNVGLVEKDRGILSNYTSYDDIGASSYYDELFTEELTSTNILELEDLVKSGFDKKYEFTKEVTTSMWQLEGGNTEYEPDFCRWIDDLNVSWKNYRDYEKFFLYRKQADMWLKDSMTVFDPQASQDAQLSYLSLEVERMRQNSLYALSKFLYLKDEWTNNPRGIKYKAWRCQEFILFIYDLLINSIIGKCRQIGFTSTLCAAGIVKTLTRRNFTCKMVAEKGKKVEEIFRDKVKYAVDELPAYLTPSIESDTQTQLWFIKKLAKGKTTGARSLFKVEAPTVNCINGGSPSQVFIDEGGLLDILGDIISQGRPALYRLDPQTNKLKLARHLMIWGTGGNMAKGGAAMEDEFRAAKEAWKDRDFSHGIMPIFLNLFAKPGADRAFYEKERKSYYSRKKKAGEEDPKLVFHQSYPIVEEDMFLLSSETLIPTVAITRHLERCRKIEKVSAKKGGYLRGYLIPLFDKSEKYPEGYDIPYKAIGAKFVACSDADIVSNSPYSIVTIAVKPDPDWTYRYSQGTDPIFTSSGTSNMGSTVWDRLLDAPVAWVDGKTEDYRYVYLQCHLLNLYYGMKRGSSLSGGIPELVETNVGGEYINYRIDRGYRRTLIFNQRLPAILRTASVDRGIRKTAKNSPFLIQSLEEILILYQNNIKMAVFWQQLKTFVAKKTSSNNVSYAPQNKNYHKDDILDSTLYSKLASDTMKVAPQNKSMQTATKKRRRKLVMNPNTYTLEMAWV